MSGCQNLGWLCMPVEWCLCPDCRAAPSGRSWCRLSLVVLRATAATRVARATESSFSLTASDTATRPSGASHASRFCCRCCCDVRVGQLYMWCRSLMRLILMRINALEMHSNISRSLCFVLILRNNAIFYKKKNRSAVQGEWSDALVIFHFETVVGLRIVVNYAIFVSFFISGNIGLLSLSVRLDHVQLCIWWEKKHLT